MTTGIIKPITDTRLSGLVTKDGVVGLDEEVAPIEPAKSPRRWTGTPGPRMLWSICARVRHLPSNGSRRLSSGDGLLIVV
jgi:hypothetical protein